MPVPPEGDQEYVNGAVPPEAVTVAVPFVPPLQETSVCEPVADSAAGSVTAAEAVVMHPFASVTVQV